MQYFFILGRIKELSTAELLKFVQFQGGPSTPRVSGPRGQSFEVKEISEKFIILETDKKIDLSFWQKQLGGIVKCGEVIKETQEFLEEEVKEILLNKIKKGTT